MLLPQPRGPRSDWVVRALRQHVRAEAGGGVAERLRRMTAADTAPSLSRHLHRHATMTQFREFVAHRSVYHPKEADPHTFAIPRLRGPAKAAMVEIQSDEYGGGRFGRMHSTLFATNNLMSMFGLHRRWRGAAAGHLASIEMTSSHPNRRYGQGLRRLGGSERACHFFDEHVEADAVHEQIAAYDLCEYSRPTNRNSSRTSSSVPPAHCTSMSCSRGTSSRRGAARSRLCAIRRGRARHERSGRRGRQCDGTHKVSKFTSTDGAT